MFTSSPVQTETKDQEEQDTDVLEPWLVVVPQYVVVPRRALLSTGCQMSVCGVTPGGAIVLSTIYGFLY